MEWIIKIALRRICISFPESHFHGYHACTFFFKIGPNLKKSFEVFIVLSSNVAQWQVSTFYITFGCFKSIILYIFGGTMTLQRPV